MIPINKNWMDENGNHQGGQSIGDSYTIVWQRGPLNESGRNGAFLIEVLGGCLAWMKGSPSERRSICEIGFTAVFAGHVIAEDQATLIQILKSCLTQICRYQDQPKFVCTENDEAIDLLLEAMEEISDLDKSFECVEKAQSVLMARRDRRASDGTLGTHKGEKSI